MASGGILPSIAFHLEALVAKARASAGARMDGGSSPAPRSVTSKAVPLLLRPFFVWMDGREPPSRRPSSSSSAVVFPSSPEALVSRGRPSVGPNRRTSPVGLTTGLSHEVKRRG
eukprot:scaffold68_cov340-Pavlova_lutheri.AAC.23